MNRRPSEAATPQPVAPSLSAKSQEQVHTIPVTLKELFTDRKLFEVLPPFQRKDVWGLAHQQAFIDSLLRGDPVPALEGYQEQDEHGVMVWKLIDGHQRKTAILNFMDNKFKTWTATQKERAEPNSEPPVEPGKFYKQLSVPARNHFQQYKLSINKVAYTTPQQMATRFLRIQNHMPLSAAEKLNIYSSITATIAKRLAAHPFWDNFYEGKSDRQQTFQCSLWLVALETMRVESLDLASWSFLHNLVAGHYDKNIQFDPVYNAIDARLKTVSRLFFGSHFTRRVVVIAMYQSTLILEQAGYTFSKTSDKGKLTPWLESVLGETRRTPLQPNYSTAIQQILRPAQRQTFWAKHQPRILGMFGLGPSQPAQPAQPAPSNSELPVYRVKRNKQQSTEEQGNTLLDQISK
jgi:Protein of unknown function DUF262